MTVTVFIVTAALLIAAALFFVLRPLLRRSRAGAITRDALNTAVYRDQLRELDTDLAAGTIAQDDYDRARRELEKRLLEDVSAEPALTDAEPRGRAVAIAAAVAVPVIAIGVYLAVGNPRALEPQASAPAFDPKQIEAMVAGLAERMKANPENAEGWVMLGRSYAVMGRFDEAARAYANAVSRLPENAQLLADYADALAMAQGQTLTGEPAKLVARALELDPSNMKALALGGAMEFEKKNYAGAVVYWDRLLRGLPAGSEMTQSVQSSIAEAQALAAGSKK